MKPKAIFFDVDGTIIPLDSAALCLQDTCRHFKIRILTKKEIKEKTIGYKLTKAIPPLLPETKDYIKEFIEYFKNLYVKNWKKYSKPFPYVKKIFKEIRKRKIKIGIVTTKRRDEALAVLNGYKIDYDVLVSQDDVKKIKPDPEPVFKACKLLKVKPEEVIFVGDHPFDIMAAEAAGCFSVGVLTGFGTKDSLKEAGTDLVLKDLRGLNKLIK